MGFLFVNLAPTAPTPASWPAWWRVAGELGYFAALAVVIGGTLTYLAVVRPVLRATDRMSEDTDALVMRNHSARLLTWPGLALVVAAYFQLATRVARATPPTPFGQALAPSRMWQFLTQAPKAGSWASTGTLFLVQNLLFVVAAALLVATRYAIGRLDTLVTVAVIAAVAASAVASVPTNLSTQTTDSALGVLMSQVHIVAGCAYLGGLAGLASLSRARHALGAHAGLFWARIWQRFSVLALTAVGGIIISGSWLTWKHVGGLSEFATTTYGRFLLAKLVLVLALISAGAYNQFLLTPRIARAHAAGDIGTGFALTLRHFPAVVTIEAALGAGVLLIVPFLSGSARAQAGDGPTPTIDGIILFLGILLVAGLAATFYASHRVSLLLTYRAAAEGHSLHRAREPLPYTMNRADAPATPHHPWR
ncbi:MAG TPA: CopD family protein [Pseudonocardiaceae bacterium]|nr:CopD family protein [Pseudonocardiaceae bacterium]